MGLKKCKSIKKLLYYSNYLLLARDGFLSYGWGRCGVYSWTVHGLHCTVQANCTVFPDLDPRDTEISQPGRNSQGPDLKREAERGGL